MTTTYQPIVFMQGDDARIVLETLDISGKSAALEYLKQWDYGDYSPTTEESAAGSDDDTYTEGDYVMSWNTRLGYIGLERVD